MLHRRCLFHFSARLKETESEQIPSEDAVTTAHLPGLQQLTTDAYSSISQGEMADPVEQFFFYYYFFFLQDLEAPLPNQYSLNANVITG